MHLVRAIYHDPHTPSIIERLKTGDKSVLVEEEESVAMPPPPEESEGAPQLDEDGY